MPKGSAYWLNIKKINFSVTVTRSVRLIFVVMRKRVNVLVNRLNPLKMKTLAKLSPGSLVVNVISVM